MASLASGAGMIAGCAAQPSPERQVTETAEPTLPPNITTYTETKPLPEPDGIQSRAAARSFVETYEQRYVYNRLVSGYGNTEPATEITVEPSEAAIVYTTDRGYYLLSACSGSAEFYQPDSSSGMHANQTGVAHFVGDGLHRRIPFNAYRCVNPIVPTPTDDKQETPTARLQLYDFSTDPNNDQPNEGGHQVAVSVRDDDGTAILDQSYQTSLPLTVQPRATDTPGSYTISASLPDGPTVERQWTLSPPRSPVWWAIAIVITTTEELAMQRFYPNDTVGLPSGTLCER